MKNCWHRDMKIPGHALMEIPANRLGVLSDTATVSDTGRMGLKNAGRQGPKVGKIRAMIGSRGLENAAGFSEK